MQVGRSSYVEDIRKILNVSQNGMLCFRLRLFICLVVTCWERADLLALVYDV